MSCTKNLGESCKLINNKNSNGTYCPIGFTNDAICKQQDNSNCCSSGLECARSIPWNNEGICQDPSLPIPCGGIGDNCRFEYIQDKNDFNNNIICSAGFDSQKEYLNNCDVVLSTQCCKTGLRCSRGSPGQPGGKCVDPNNPKSIVPPIWCPEDEINGSRVYSPYLIRTGEDKGKWICKPNMDLFPSLKDAANYEKFFDQTYYDFTNKGEGRQSSCQSPNTRDSDVCKSDFTTPVASEDCTRGIFEFGLKKWCYPVDKWLASDKESCCGLDPSVLDSQGKLMITKCKLVNPDQVTISNDRKIKVRAYEGAWAPFSSECMDSDAMKNYCSGQDIDHTGKMASRLITSENCKNWCDYQDKKSSSICDNVKKQYCADNPDADECACFYPEKDLQWNNFQNKIIEAAGGGIIGQLPPYSCWSSNCQSLNNLITNEVKEQQDVCAKNPVDIQICQQIVKVIGDGKIDIGKINLNQQCNFETKGDLVIFNDAVIDTPYISWDNGEKTLDTCQQTAIDNKSNFYSFNPTGSLNGTSLCRIAKPDASEPKLERIENSGWKTYQITSHIPPTPSPPTPSPPTPSSKDIRDFLLKYKWYIFGLGIIILILLILYIWKIFSKNKSNQLALNR